MSNDRLRLIRMDARIAHARRMLQFTNEFIDAFVSSRPNGLTPAERTALSRMLAEKRAVQDELTILEEGRNNNHCGKEKKG